jgi:hypothetical protein
VTADDVAVAKLSALIERRYSRIQARSPPGVFIPSVVYFRINTGYRPTFDFTVPDGQLMHLYSGKKFSLADDIQVKPLRFIPS